MTPGPLGLDRIVSFSFSAPDFDLYCLEERKNHFSPERQGSSAKKGDFYESQDLLEPSSIVI